MLIMFEDKITQYAKETHTYTLECPYCGKNTLVVNETMYNLPRLGEVLLISKNCSSCGYKHNDMMPLKKKRRKRIYIKVENKEDLKTKILRTSMTRIEIPEIGAEMVPGIIAPFFVTNIEGVLQRFLDILSTMNLLEVSEKKDNLSIITKKIEQMMIGKIPFTVIIDDPWGIGGIYEKSRKTLVITEYVE